MCQGDDSDCVAAYHDCPYKGVSSQVDSEGIVIKPGEKHNQIIKATCYCLNDWSGAGCTNPPQPPPTEEPWPDPYDNISGARSKWSGQFLATLALASCALGIQWLLLS